jgi:hypothetical protein
MTTTPNQSEKLPKKICTVFDWVGAKRTPVHNEACCAAAYSPDND